MFSMFSQTGAPHRPEHVGQQRDIFWPIIQKAVSQIRYWRQNSEYSCNANSRKVLVR